MRRAFVPPRKAGAPGAAQPLPAAAAAAPPPFAVFDCTFTPQHKKRGATSDGTLVLTGSHAQLYDLRLREVAAGALPPAAAAALHAAHAAALVALVAGQPLGSLWPASADAEPPTLTVGQFAVDIDDDRCAAVRPEDWALRQAVVALQGQNGKINDAAGPPIPVDSLGERCTGWGCGTLWKMKGHRAACCPGFNAGHVARPNRPSCCPLPSPLQERACWAAWAGPRGRVWAGSQAAAAPCQCCQCSSMARAAWAARRT